MRSKGEGSIYRRTSDNLWCATIELPPRDGKRRRKTITGKNKNDVIRKLNRAKIEYDSRGDLPSEAQTVAQFLTYWLEDMATRENRPKTVAGYRSVINGHIIPTIGSVRLSKLTPAHVRRMTDRMLEAGMSSTYALNAHRVLSSALTVAEREGRIYKNVAKLSPAPRKAVTELNVLTVGEATRLVDMFSNGTPEKYLWAAIILTGGRRGEVLGLTWDRVTDVVDFSWQLQRFTWNHGCGDTCGRKRGTDCPNRRLDSPRDFEVRHVTGGLWLARPKSRAGWRIFPMFGPLEALLSEWRTQWEPNPYNLVFAGPDGQPIDPDRATEKWPDVLRAAGIDKHVVIHGLRHTAVDIAYAAGIPEAVIIELFGHSAVAMSRAYRSKGNRLMLDDAARKFAAQFQIAAPENPLNGGHRSA